jgi:coniferyl-aldehyde dehydrogenase
LAESVTPGWVLMAGKAGFLTFSHARSIYRQGKSSEAELALRPPFTPAFQASLSKAINR